MGDSARRGTQSAAAPVCATCGEGWEEAAAELLEPLADALRLDVDQLWNDFETLLTVVEPWEPSMASLQERVEALQAAIDVLITDVAAHK